MLSMGKEGKEKYLCLESAPVCKTLGFVFGGLHIASLVPSLRGIFRKLLAGKI